VRLTADTNSLVRAVVDDDPVQGRLARDALAGADIVALTLPALCEFVRVLARGYHLSGPDIHEAVRRLISADNVAVDRAAAEAGLAMLAAGGDFADGVIAHEGAWLGGEVFLSFDRKAVDRLQANGIAARLPA
jgi:predicted nucleic-acid-binding protein